MGKKDFLLISGALALLAAPAALAEGLDEITLQSQLPNSRENEGVLSKEAEFKLEESTTRSQKLSSLFNPSSISENNSYNFQKLPSSEFSFLSSQQLPSVDSADVADNPQVRHNPTVSNPPISANTQIPPLKSVTLENESNNQLSTQTPEVPGEIAETSPVTEPNSPDLQQFSTECNTVKDAQPCAPTSNLYFVDLKNAVNDSINLDISEESSTNDPLAQVTSVSQLSDVQPTDWAFLALQRLVERYGCIAGYFDGTFRGNQALTRYEFAAGLNACLTQMERLIAASTADFVKKEDLETLQRLTDEFRPELTSLRDLVDTLEARTTQLESHQFSTTAVIGGEVIFGLATAGGGNPPGTGKANTVLSNLTRLQLVTSFTGIDRLRLELAASNFSGLGFADPSVLNTYTSLLSYQSDTGNQIQLSSLEYRFPAFRNRVVFTLRPVGFSLSSVLSANSPYFDTGRGAISRFAEANPIFKIGALDAGVGFDWLLSKRARLQVAYGASNGNNSSEGFLFSGDSNVLGVQLLLVPGNNVQTGLAFVYGYSSTGRLNTFTGSAIADASGYINLPSNIYALSGTLQWRLTPTVTFSTWGGLSITYANVTNAFAVTTNFMFALGFSDPFGRRGDLFALMIGQPPRLIQVAGYTGANGGLLENSSSLHLEAFYRFSLTDRISITPGLFVVTNPGNIDDNNTIYVGTIRTTFRF